jgi:hypothetical protein
MPLSRWLFSLAVLWHLACGIAAVFFTDSVLSLFHLPVTYRVAVAACRGALSSALALGCLLGLWAPERATVVAGILLAVHVLVGAAWLAAVKADQLPPQTFPAVLICDLLWVFPWTFVLLQNHRLAPAIIAGIAVVVHVLACVALLVVRSGTEIEPDMALRAAWVHVHPVRWSATWLLWALASMSLLAFTIVWACRLRQAVAFRGWIVLGCGILGVGVAFDLVGESINIVGPTLPGCTVADFAFFVRTYALLSAAAANGLYCVGGLLLSAQAWKVGWLRGWVGLLGFVMWTVGLGLTAAALADNGPGMIVTGGAVMLLYIPWAAIVGYRLPGTGASWRAPLRGAAKPTGV